MRRKYYAYKPGEWITPIRKGYRLMCCGCGLTHVVNHRLRVKRFSGISF